jgi:hypothetical protein
LAVVVAAGEACVALAIARARGEGRARGEAPTDEPRPGDDVGDGWKMPTEIGSPVGDSVVSSGVKSP